MTSTIESQKSQKNAARASIVLLMLVASMSGVSCGTSNPEDRPRRVMIGEEPSFFSATYTMASASENRLVTIDEKIGRLHEFSLEPFQHTASWPLPFATRGQTVIGSPDGAFNIVLSGADWAVIRRDGLTTINPVELAGEIGSWAWDQSTSTLVLSDDRGSIAMMELSPDGTVKTSWISGPRLGGDSSVVKTGALLPGGTLVLATTADKLVLIDTKNTMQNQALQARNLEIEGIADIEWMAPVLATPGVILTQSPARISIVDTRNSVVTDEASMLDIEVLSRWREREPHIFITSASNRIPESAMILTVSADLKLVQTELMGNRARLDRVGQSWLHEGILTVMDSGGTLDQIRIADNLTLLNFEAPLKAQIAVTSQWMVIQHPSILGAIERRAYRRSTGTARIEAHNMPWLKESQK